MNNVSDIVEVVGGADGPTSIFLAGRLGDMGMGVMIAAVVIGLLLCFFGLKVVRILTALIGFAVGAGVGVTIVNQAGTTGFTNIIIIFACAVILAAISFFIYRAGVFLMTFSIAGGIIMMMIDLSVSVQLIAALAVTLVLAIIAVIFLEPSVIIITALAGGMTAGLNIASIANWTESPLIGMGIGAVLSILGLIVQFVMHAKKVGKKEKVHSDKYKKTNSMESEVEKARMLLDDEDDEESEDKKEQGSGIFDDVEILDEMDDDIQDQE